MCHLQGGFGPHQVLTFDDDKFLLRSTAVSHELDIARDYHPNYAPGPRFHGLASVLTSLLVGIYLKRVGDTNIQRLESTLQDCTGEHRTENIDLNQARFRFDRTYMTSIGMADYLLRLNAQILGTFRKNANSKETQMLAGKARNKVFLTSFIKFVGILF